MSSMKGFTSAETKEVFPKEGARRLIKAVLNSRIKKWLSTPQQPKKEGIPTALLTRQD